MDKMALGKNLSALVLAGAILFNPIDAYAKKIKIAIVPGHGPLNYYLDGEDKACAGIAGNERYVAYNLAKQLESNIEANNDGDVGVLVTRNLKNYNSDIVKFIKKFAGINPKHINYNTALIGTAVFMKQNNFDIMLNVHMNKAEHRTSKTKGFSIYYSDANTRVWESISLAKYIRDALQQNGFKPTNNYGEGAINESHKWALLGKPDFPANSIDILIECDYIDNKKFSNPKVRERFSEAVYYGLRNFVSHRYNVKI
jgi:N-acetylmuramoyl-L-alanine amidase